MASVSSFVLTVALLAIGLGATAAQTLGEGLGATSGGLGLLLTAPSLAPAIAYLFSDTSLLSSFTEGNLFPALAADPPAIAALIQSPSFVEVLDNPTTLTEIVSAPQLSALNDAPESDIPAIIAEFVGAAKVPATGDPKADLAAIVAILDADAGIGIAPAPAPTPAPAPASSSTRRMLRGTTIE